MKRDSMENSGKCHFSEPQRLVKGTSRSFYQNRHGRVKAPDIPVIPFMVRSEEDIRPADIYQHFLAQADVLVIRQSLFLYLAVCVEIQEGREPVLCLKIHCKGG